MSRFDRVMVAIAIVALCGAVIALGGKVERLEGLHPKPDDSAQATPPTTAHACRAALRSSRALTERLGQLVELQGQPAPWRAR